MKWTDNSITKDILFKDFKDLKVGEGFETDEILYIKVGDNYAFDVINNKGDFFQPTYEVTPRDCEIIFY